VAAGAYLLVSWQSGYLAHPTAGVFSSPDSHEYRQVADWIFGARGSADASAWRPFLYPLVLGLADRVGGTTAVWLLNLALWFAAMNIAAAAAYRLVKSEWAAILAFLALATNVSLILLTYQARDVLSRHTHDRNILNNGRLFFHFTKLKSQICRGVLTNNQEDASAYSLSKALLLGADLIVSNWKFEQLILSCLICEGSSCDSSVEVVCRHCR